MTYQALYTFITRRDSEVCITSGYGLDGRGFVFEFQEEQQFSPLHVVQTYPMGTEISFPGGKAAGA
jgi:hypothetical protein